MLDPLGLLGLLALVLGGGGGGSARPRGGSGGAPRLPTTEPAPWPQVVPTDLPRFPGAGWEYDEPPPPAVVARARQLVQQLWTNGAGTTKTEQTGGRWITYRAEKVRSGKQGVVAYRLKGAATTATPNRLPPAPAAPSAAPKLPPDAGRGEPEARSPGLPQAPGMTAPIMVEVGPATEPELPIHLPDLKIGDGLPPKPVDPNVALVQQKLGIKTDGKFGNDTQTAVIEFQRKTGLAPNLPIEQLRKRGFGAVKKATWVKLFAPGST
jgi:hypothetical protein